ncbi:MAGE-domain-containing protein [Scleroderma citrinum]
MARAGPSRSQRNPEPSQRPRRARNDDDMGDEQLNPDPDLSQPKKSDSETELDRKASDLVRLALFTEHKRAPLRREDINKKVLGSNTRTFNAILERAQNLLRKTFAMELVELQSRSYREEDAMAGDEEGRNATGVKKRAAAAGSRTYILRSTLDPIIIEQATLTDERLLEQEMADYPEDGDYDDIPRHYGSIISWSSSDQLAALGVLHVVLALILANGKTISDLDLRASLKRLHLLPNSNTPMNAQSTHRAMSIDTYLGQLIRQGYLDRVRLGENKAAGGKRGRAPAATQVSAEDDQAYEWRWGNRSHAEISEEGITSFVAEFMVEHSRDARLDEEEEQGAETHGRGRGRDREDDAERKLINMQKAIERAAGGNLSRIK